MASQHRDRVLRRAPLLSAESWVEPSEALERLHSWAVEDVEDAIEWYLSDKRSKRKASRYLRGMSIGLATIGGVVPQLGSLGLPSAEQAFRIGYVAFALAAACVAFDYFFGLSSGWMRNMATAQALRRMLKEFDVKWAEETMRFSNRPLDELSIGQFVLAISSLVMGVEEAVGSETAEWSREFSKNIKGVDLGFGDSNGAPGVASGPLRETGSVKQS